MNKLKILIVEDEAPLRNLIRTTLYTHDYAFETAENGRAALMIASSLNPDLVLLDLGLPDLDGIEVIKRIRSWSNMPIIVLTARSEMSDKITALDCGADDYLTKPFAMKELLARIRSMLRRRTRYSAEELHFEGLSLRSESLELAAENSVRLSMKEFELMRLLISNPDKELSTEFILSRLWAGEPDAGADTVYLYISYLRGKLKAVDANVRIEGNRGGSFRLTKA